jgi:hypothetical protein
LDYEQPLETEAATNGSGLTPQDTPIGEVYNRPAVGDGKSTDTTEVNSGQTEGATAPAGNSSETSKGKDNTLSNEKQAKNEKSSVQGAESEGTKDVQPTVACKADVTETKPKVAPCGG